MICYFLCSVEENRRTVSRASGKGPSYLTPSTVTTMPSGVWRMSRCCGGRVEEAQGDDTTRKRVFKRLTREWGIMLWDPQAFSRPPSAVAHLHAEGSEVVVVLLERVIRRDFGLERAKDDGH